ncbi:DMT family transporter [Massilia horti]|uniref:DMT family transporter n=1 Tax=Massilia horti TaxID=2562153 RepID=A0A4Y9T8M0_9BURK|nr:DMT family transporter [Massilia horti]TFW35548.1 DMT family transporter [Massilia horti]
MASLWMVFASFAFAAMGAAVKLASGVFSTSELLMYRGLIGTAMLFLVARHQGGSFKSQFPREHLWRSAVGVISLWLWFYAIGQLPLATAVTLNYMAPIWIAAGVFAAAWWHGKKRVEWQLVLAVLMSFVGVMLVLRPAIDSDQWLGGVSGLLSSIISAMAYMQVRRLGQMGEPEYRVVFYFSLTTTVAGFAGSLLSPDAAGVRFHPIDLHAGALLAAMGVSALFAQMAMTRAYRVGKVLVVANLQYTGIVFSSLWGVLLFGDSLDWHVWLGIAVILASGVAATFYNTGSAAKTVAAEKKEPITSET